MSSNPYESPNAPSAPRVADGDLEADGRRLTDQQARWLKHSQYALRLLALMAGLLVLFLTMQVVYILVFRDPDSSQPFSVELRIRTVVINAVRIAHGAWMFLALRRFDRVIGHVLLHDAASAAVNRALRLGRNMTWALGLGTAGTILVTWILVFLTTLPAN